MKKKRWYIAIVLGIILFMIVPSLIGSNKGENTYHIFNKKENHEHQYGVASDNSMAVEVGMDVLNNGGNAVDAAVAVAYVLNVIEPSLGGIGGGGTLMVMNPDSKPVVYDYRETAPEDGDLPEKGIGVMGFVKGMETVHNDYGKLPMESLLEPAIEMANNGFKVSETLHERLKGASNRLDTEALPYFHHGKAVKPGMIIKDLEMAETLRQIQKDGSDAFYKGEIADMIHEKVPEIELSDLRNYHVEKREPLEIEYKGYSIYLPPPANGGVMIAQELLMAKHLEWDENNLHSFIKNIGTMNRLAYKDRIENIGDPNEIDMDLDELLSDEHIKNMLRKKDDDLRVELDSKGDIADHANTTHFTIIDKNGMMVSSTNTLSSFFGSGERVGGFFLNNELDNFSTSDSSSNRPKGGKRPFSYTSPIIVSKDDQPVLGIGAAGGRRITSVLTSILVQHLEFGIPLQDAVDKPRFFMELNDDAIRLEEEIPQDVKDKWKDDDFNLIENYRSVYFGSVESLEIIDGHIHGGSDKRRNGSWQSKNGT
ncbi:gamma-glutamyltransferase [Lentibacillus sp. L22]|uniref:gamma-glutamyltransferase family protein n=1 Tax=Lentibacillus TaxID=175304 RepID=UPI0022B1117C|nr:gamma-glutamyltransferase [Lentibacillus daqui]